MKTAKLLTLSALGAFLLAGCGTSDGTTTSADTVDILVERGPLLQAAVRDANGQMGVSLGNGRYRFTNPTYPIESFGGYIDVNRDGIVNAGDVAMDGLRMKTNAGAVMTLATTIASNPELYNALLELGYTQEELANLSPTGDIDIAALSDEIYKYCIENNIAQPQSITDATEIAGIKERIRSRKELYNTQTLTSVEQEAALIAELEDAQLIVPETTTVAVVSDPQQTIISTIAPVELTNEQKYTLAYMWNEERLANELYLALNALYPNQTLYNIATKSEAEHVASVEALIAKYNLNILNTQDYSGGYDASALDAYTAGTYSIEGIKVLYDALLDAGDASAIDALKVGCMVEVTDINDLNADIATVSNAEDLKIVFENLRKGSYNHYWSFDSALKAQGVSDGCCAAGTEYCKTSAEYPLPTKKGGH